MVSKLLAILTALAIVSNSYGQGSPAGYRGTTTMKLTPMIMPFNMSDEQYYPPPSPPQPGPQPSPGHVYIKDYRAHIFVHLNGDATAEVWFDNLKTRQTGKLRYFYSPPLLPGKSYVYELRIREGEKRYTEKVNVSAGSTIHIIVPR